MHLHSIKTKNTCLAHFKSKKRTPNVSNEEVGLGNASKLLEIS